MTWILRVRWILQVPGLMQASVIMTIQRPLSSELSRAQKFLITSKVKLGGGDANGWGTCSEMQKMRHPCAVLKWNILDKPELGEE